jgi:hypothetical protein
MPSPLSRKPCRFWGVRGSVGVSEIVYDRRDKSEGEITWKFKLAENE